LLSPQTYFIKCDSGRLVLTKDSTTIDLYDGSIDPNNNLPFALLDAQRWKSLVRFDDIKADTIILNVTAEANQNLSGPQKELLFWDYVMAHGAFQWIQSLMKPKRPRYKKNLDDFCLARPVIMTEHFLA
jgi:hypothetical protein